MSTGLRLSPREKFKILRFLQKVGYHLPEYGVIIQKNKLHFQRLENVHSARRILRYTNPILYQEVTQEYLQ
jgi:hypothetical protein